MLLCAFIWIVAAQPAWATIDPGRIAASTARTGSLSPTTTPPAAGPFAKSLGVPPALWSITAPTEPRVEGATGVVYSGGLLYVTSYSPTSGHSSLSIVNPTTQAFVGSVSDPDLDGAASLAVQGDYAYVTGVQNRAGLTNANRLTVVDVSDPTSPSVVGSVQDGTLLYGAFGVQVSGNVAYVAAQGCVPSVCNNPALGNRLVVVDVSDKADPKLIGSVADPTAKTAHLDALAVVGNRVYGTAFGSKTLTVFDVTDPTKPTIVGSLTNSLLTSNNDVVVRGRYAYVIDQSIANSARLVVVDIADPVHPTVVGSALDATNLDEGYWLKLVGDNVFVAAAGSAALTVVNVSDPAHPEVVASISDPSILGIADGIDVADGTAYVAAFCTTPNSGCSTPTTGALSAFDVQPYTAVDFSGGPAADDSSSTPVLSFTTLEADAPTTCSLDHAAAVPCTSPFVPASPLAAGPHSLTVSAAAGAATWSWTLDAPTISSPVSGSASTNTTPVFQGTAGTRPGDLNSVAVSLYSGAGVGGSPLQTLNASSSPASGAYSVASSPALVPGTYTAQAAQANTAGKTATSLPVTFTIAPAAPSSNGPSPEGGAKDSPSQKGALSSPPAQGALTIVKSGDTYSPGQATVRLACTGRKNAQCRGTLRLKLRGSGRPTVIGKAVYALDAGTKKAVRVGLNRSGRRSVAGAAKSLRVQASATSVGGATVTSVLTLEGTSKHE